MVGLTSALAQLAPAALALPGIILGLGAAFAALKIGMSGVADAIRSGDLSGLAPNAAAGVTAIRSLKTAYDDLKSSVQSNLFAGLAEPLREAGQTLIPIFKAGLSDIATGFNGMAKQALAATQNPFFKGDLVQILGNTSSAIGNMRSTLANLLSGFVGLGAVGSDYLPRLGSAVDSVAAKFKQWVDSGVEDGSIKRMIDSAITGFKDLGAIVGNIGSVISSVFQGLSAGSGATSFLATIRDTTAALAEFFRSAEAQGPLQALGQTMAVAGAAVRDILLAALKAAGPILSALAPLVQAFASALSTALVGAFTALGPPLAQVASALSTGLAPVLPLIAGLFVQLATAAGQILTALAPVVGQLLAGLLPAFKALLPVIGQAAVTIGTALAGAITKIVESGAIEKIGTAFTSVITALAPLIPQIAQLAADLLPVLADIFINVVVPAIEIAAGIIRTVIIPAIESLISFVRMVVDDVKARWAEITTATDQLSSDVDAALQFFRDLPGKFAEWMTSVGTAVNTGVGNVVGFFREMPGKITSALGNLGSLLVNAGKSLMDGLLSGIRNGLQSVLDFARSIAGQIAAVKGPIPKDRKELIPAGLALMHGLHKGLRAGFRPVLKEAGGMAAELAKTFTDLGADPLLHRVFDGHGFTTVTNHTAELSGAVQHESFGSRDTDALADAVIAGMTGCAWSVDSNGMAKLVNKSNTRKRRR
ncbi:MAG: hypothetical protein BGP03_10210 [Pseudonocardia sp. 73-21]|nr:MAG: hypothetical protein BGP03_10210 [Pseudonocardia sp. 73-21]